MTTGFIGCDVSKAKLDFATLNDKDDALDSFKVTNDAVGFSEATCRLAELRGARVVVEATSHYHYGIAFALREAGFDVCVINPLITKKYSSSAIRKTKTDKVDAVRLARIGRCEPNLQAFRETGPSLGKKQLAKLLARLKNEIRKLRQRLAQVEENSACPAAITECMATALREVIDVLVRNAALLEKRLVKLVGADAELVATIPGVSVVNAARIVAELGDVSRFRDRNQVSAFAGLDPSVHESGSSVRGRSRISKRGSTELRAALGQSAWGVMMHNPRFRAYAQKKKAEGKHYFTILVAMARKLLLLIAAMLNAKRAYDPNLATL